MAKIAQRNVTVRGARQLEDDNLQARRLYATEIIDERGKKIITTIAKYARGCKAWDCPCCIKKFGH